MDDVNKKQKAVQNKLQEVIEGIGEERFWELYDLSIDPLNDGFKMMVDMFGTEEQKRRAAEIRWDKLAEHMEARQKEEE